MIKRAIVVVLVLVGCGDKKAATPSATPVEVAAALAVDAAAAAVVVDAAPAEPAAPDARKPTDDEIDRCARLLIIATRCGISDDFEFGWIKGEAPRKMSPHEARTACAVDRIEDEDGMSAFPATVFEPAVLAKVEAAMKGGCKRVFKVLDEVDERLTPAGMSPVGP